MNSIAELEVITCPFCCSDQSNPWAVDNRFTAVRCCDCGLIYVNPRPNLALISKAVKTGVHSEVTGGRPVTARRVARNVARYKSLFGSMFADVLGRGSQNPISWLDVGAGYGETVEAVCALAPPGSMIRGIEPMHPKADNARKRGLDIREMYLEDVQDKYQFVSLVHVFSHIPDFRLFLTQVKRVLTSNGELYLETGNIGDLKSASQVPTELDLPDHLVFAGEKHIVGYLNDAGFEIVEIKKFRQDSLVNFVKVIIKKLIGRNVTISMPYSSPYRSLAIRSRLIQ